MGYLEYEKAGQSKIYFPVEVAERGRLPFYTHVAMSQSHLTSCKQKASIATSPDVATCRKDAISLQKRQNDIMRHLGMSHSNSLVSEELNTNATLRHKNIEDYIKSLLQDSQQRLLVGNGQHSLTQNMTRIWVFATRSKNRLLKYLYGWRTV